MMEMLLLTREKNKLQAETRRADEDQCRRDELVPANISTKLKSEKPKSAVSKQA